MEWLYIFPVIAAVCAPEQQRGLFNLHAFTVVYSPVPVPFTIRSLLRSLLAAWLNI